MKYSVITVRLRAEQREQLDKALDRLIETLNKDVSLNRFCVDAIMDRADELMRLPDPPAPAPVGMSPLASNEELAG